MFLLAASTTASGFESLFALLFFAAIVVAFVMFFRGPARSSELYAEQLAQQIRDPGDAALFRNIYRTKGPKSVVLAWVLTVFLSPTISYLYQGKWGLAIIAFLTIQGFFVWWLISMFTMPMEVARHNRKLADEAFNQLMIARPNVARPDPIVAN